MRAFFHEDQRRHRPKQFMRVGRLAEPTDLPSRVDPLLQALQARNIAIDAPLDDGLAPALTVHRADYLDYLASAYMRWQEIPNAGPEVLPNLSPYWNAVPGVTRPPCPSPSIIAQTGYYLGDLAVPLGAESWPAILAASQVAAGAAEAVLAGAEAGYALCRPSGHHARADRANGFCYVNNAAIAAQRLRQKFARVAVLDVDAHHGDGTQEIFYARGDVLTVSIHADPMIYYPFYTGYEAERGCEAGLGFNRNIPLPRGASDADFHAAVGSAADTIKAFGAEALVLSLGFDSHRDDPIGVLGVTTAGFGGIGRRVRALGLPTVVVQEGGYQIDVIGDCLGAFLDGYLQRG